MSGRTRSLCADAQNITSAEKLISPPRPKVFVIAGPTAVGKSAAALKLCQMVQGEIISADSVQLYKRLNVGANKATEEERALVPHHMINVADPACDDFTAGDFFRSARKAVDDVINRGNVPVVVGGTMMYVRWFVYGRPATPAVGENVKLKVREALSSVRDDWEAGLALLAERDPKRAAALSRNDWYRLGRALEIIESTGIPMTDMPLQGGAPQTQHSTDVLDYDFRCVFLYDDRIPLNRRIDARCEEMILPRGDLAGECEMLIEKSILTEVSQLLLSRGLRVAPASPAFAIGYRQTIAYLTERALAWSKTQAETSMLDDVDDQKPSAEALHAFRSFLEGFQSATRGYAKEQLKWFRKEALFHWIKAGSESEEALGSILYMDELEHEQFRSEHESNQLERREDIMRQGKEMKRYITEKQWLVNGSKAEDIAVLAGERHASELASSLSTVELEEIQSTISH
ncbi:tRNA dimethylallyltransferase isoform 1 [Gracilaria domingensis]|nr:tRNA dimethylallyltransferase isoform 1 [Gracilaria domingensis]